MQDLPHSDQPQTLKTATGIADPVLLRLTTGRLHVLLLAEDLSHNSASTMLLTNVQWACVRHGWRRYLRIVQTRGTRDGMRLRRTAGFLYAAVPGMPSIRVETSPDAFTLVNLSRVQYEALRTASPRRWLQGTRRRVVARSSLRTATQAVKRLARGAYRAFSRAMLPSLGR
jgi:hypothetical protein